MSQASKPPKSSTMPTSGGAPRSDKQNSVTAGPCGPVLLQGKWFFDK